METCCDGLVAIARVCNLRAKGLTPNFEIGEACDVETIPAPDADTHTISTDITVATGKQFYPWAFADDDNLQFTSNAEGQRNDKTLINALTIFIPGDEDAIDAAIHKILNGTFVIRFSKKDGKKKLFGSKASPVTIDNYQYTSDGTTEGALITFRNVGEKPYNYSGAIPLEPVV